VASHPSRKNKDAARVYPGIFRVNSLPPKQLCHGFTCVNKGSLEMSLKMMKAKKPTSKMNAT